MRLLVERLLVRDALDTRNVLGRSLEPESKP